VGTAGAYYTLQPTIAKLAKTADMHGRLSRLSEGKHALKRTRYPLEWDPSHRQAVTEQVKGISLFKSDFVTYTN
jgi:hypothetical protein